MSAPTKPQYPMHVWALTVVRRKAVYRPGVEGEEIQRLIQLLIRNMTEDGYPPDAIHALLSQAGEIAVLEAQKYGINVARARFFQSLVHLELESNQ